MSNSTFRRSRFHALLRHTGRCLRACEGNTVVEFALISPALFGFLAGVLVLGFILWMQNALNYSVAEAARCAANNPGTCGSPPTQSLVSSYAAGVAGAGLSSSVFTYTAPTNGSCGYHVTASYQIHLSIPIVHINNPTLTASACFPN